MLATLLAMTLCATPFKGASAGISVSGVPSERSEFYSEFVAQQLAAFGVSIITPKQIATLLGMERQKQLLGCSDGGTSCVAEIASALGVDGVVQGEAAKLESGGFQVSLKILWSRDGRALSVFTGRAVDEGGLMDVMGKGAALMAKDLTEGDWVRLTSAPASHSITPSSPVKVVGLSLLGLGAVAIGAGAVGLAHAGSVAGQLQRSTFLSLGEAQAVAKDGSSSQTLGLVFFGVGAASLVAGGVLTFLGFSSDVRPMAFFGPSGGTVGLVGVLP